MKSTVFYLLTLALVLSGCSKEETKAPTPKTGVEMEALTAASVAALTIYDMCKALSHNITIQEIKLLEKTGGKKDFKRIKE